jgi:SAM-dependent methyltransferase
MSENRKECRCCGNEDLKIILSLGRMPLANALLKDDSHFHNEETYPLDLAFCPRCSLVQITETISPDKLFSEYLYFSSFSDTMLEHASKLCEKIANCRKLGSNSLVVEIASNDGYLLQYYKEKGISVLGIEPALNVAKVAIEKRGIDTLCSFFNSNLANELKEKGLQADIIHGHNVLAHATDLNDFVQGISIILKKNGTGVIEVPYIKELLDNCEFDTIYHEHLCYFSLTALDYLFKKHGLAIYEVERSQIHGGSLRIWVRHAKDALIERSVKDLLEEEKHWGVDRESFYQGFANNVSELKISLCKMLKNLKNNGKKIVAYGAAAKGSTLLNYCEIGKEIVDFVVDRSTYKQGRYIPGVHLPIYHPHMLQKCSPDYVLLLTWNFEKEILSQQEAYRQSGGKFIIPIPEPKIV